MPAKDPASYDRDEPGHGRAAAEPWRIPWRGWRDILWRTILEVSGDKLTTVAGSITYCALLAIFPAIGVFVSIYGLVADLSDVQRHLEQMAVFFPPTVLKLVGDQMVRLAEGRTGGLSTAFAISLLLSLWSANAGMKSLFDGVNTAYDETERRNYFQRTLMTYAFTAALLVFLTAMTALMVAVPLSIASWEPIRPVVLAGRWIALLVLASAAFTAIYRFAPSRRPARWLWLAPGGTAAALLWLAISAGFSWYVNNLMKLDATYGSLGAVIGFMLWVWFSVLVVLIGAEFTSEIEHQTACDTTVGPPKPMGERHATMADELGPAFKGVGALWGGLRSRVAGLRPVRPPAPPAARPGPPRSAGR
ncbi:MAG TPA: YihY/virulence factor BrkB family protein [Phenylobacterium sp.]|nr:YihY/virulence factor BrkB family protein [Phenylobacterium sp.]